MTHRLGSVGQITKVRHARGRFIYVVRFINRTGEWEERTAKEGLERRAVVIDSKVADVLISMQLNQNHER